MSSSGFPGSPVRLVFPVGKGDPVGAAQRFMPSRCGSLLVELVETEDGTFGFESVPADSSGKPAALEMNAVADALRDQLLKMAGQGLLSLLSGLSMSFVRAPSAAVKMVASSIYGKFGNPKPSPSLATPSLATLLLPARRAPTVPVPNGPLLSSVALAPPRRWRRAPEPGSWLRLPRWSVFLPGGGDARCGIFRSRQVRSARKDPPPFWLRLNPGKFLSDERAADLIAAGEISESELVVWATDAVAEEQAAARRAAERAATRASTPNPKARERGAEGRRRTCSAASRWRALRP